MENAGLPHLDYKSLNSAENVEKDRLVSKHANALEKAGHCCVSIQEIYPRRLFWCMSHPCIKHLQSSEQNLSEDLDNLIQEEIKLLEELGHDCVQLAHCDPPLVQWCGSSKCDPSYKGVRIDNPF